MKGCKSSWVLVAVLAVIVAALGYKFTVGNVQPSDDGRQAVMLSKDERNALLFDIVVGDACVVAKLARHIGCGFRE